MIDHNSPEANASSASSWASRRGPGLMFTLILGVVLLVVACGSEDPTAVESSGVSISSASDDADPAAETEAAQQADEAAEARAAEEAAELAEAQAAEAAQARADEEAAEAAASAAALAEVEAEAAEAEAALAEAQAEVDAAAEEARLAAEAAVADAEDAAEAAGGSDEPVDELTEAEQLAALDRAAETFDREIGACVIGELADNDRGVLQAYLQANSLADLPFDDQATVASAALSCDPEGFSDLIGSAASLAGGDEFPVSVGPCLGENLEGSPPALVGIVALGEERAVPEEAVTALVDILTECVGGEVFGDLFVAEFNSDPDLAEAFDEQCLRTELSDSRIRELWTIFVTMPDADFDTSPELQAIVGVPIINCLSLGEALRQGAAEAGLVLSDAAVECIDDDLRSSGALNGFLEGTEPDEAVLGAALFKCLTPEEIAEFLGG